MRWRNCNVQPRELLASARILLRSKQGRPTDASLRRAVSAGYYALFHCVCHECADLLIGPRKSKRSEEAWRQVYRSLDHNAAKRRCRNPSIDNFPSGIKGFADVFVTMQDKRHDADYNPRAQFTRSSVTNDLQVVGAAMTNFKKAPLSDRRAFCALLLFALRDENSSGAAAKTKKS
jgi:hypothetical protein